MNYCHNLLLLRRGEDSGISMDDEPKVEFKLVRSADSQSAFQSGANVRVVMIDISIEKRG